MSASYPNSIGFALCFFVAIWSDPKSVSEKCEKCYKLTTCSRQIFTRSDAKHRWEIGMERSNNKQETFCKQGSFPLSSPDGEGFWSDFCSIYVIYMASVI